MGFSQKLRQLRKSAGLTQRQMAEQLEVSLRAYQNYERGVRPKDSAVYDRAARRFGVTMDSLISDQELFIDSLKAKYGGGAALQAQQILDATGALYAGGELTEADQEAFRSHIMKIISRTIEPDTASARK